MAVRNSLLEKFPANFDAAEEILHRFSSSTKCYPCLGLGTSRQEKWLLENRHRLRERSWIFSSETATAFLSFSEQFSLDGRRCRRTRRERCSPCNRTLGSTDQRISHTLARPLCGILSQASHEILRRLSRAKVHLKRGSFPPSSHRVEWWTEMSQEPEPPSRTQRIF